ncbi:hypothetical protein BDV98DRAFT_539219 [Pterulicium gracile]|uniref:Uncharacterized protein n=1 Tax=Pterulicium gracile TaxID=1884261 RepID=A0A5C3QZM2_9AGAR|nr:hypothetical protein BDV98DRAFT_539219 [Pterula gracilis]
MTTPPSATYPPSTVPGPEHTEPEDHTLLYWSYASASILAGFSVVLAIFPRMLVVLAHSASETGTSLTPLESFLGLHFGIWLAAIGISLLLNVPSLSPIPPSASHSSTHPLMITITVTSLLSSLLAYNNKDVQALSSLFSLGFFVIGVWGLWSLVFQGTARFSKKTGADKHTSSFMFKNKASASQHKKRYREAGGQD